MTRLETIEPELAKDLRMTTFAKRQEVALIVALRALELTRFEHPVIDESIHHIKDGSRLNETETTQLESIRDDLDERYFQLQEKTKNQDSSEYLVSFSQARAVSALLFACRGADAESVSEAIYEALMSVDDRKEILGKIYSLLNI